MMNKLTYSLKQGESLNRWLLLEMLETKKQFDQSTQEGNINDWLLKGHAIHEFPGKKQFLKERSFQEPIVTDSTNIFPGAVQIYKDVPKQWLIYMPFGNPLVEKEGFWNVPTHLESRAYTEINCEVEGEYRFSLATCGGLKIWVNNYPEVHFEPFTRNQLTYTSIHLPLKKGNNKIEVYFDDLAERDTKFSFRLDYLGKDELEIQLPIGNYSATEIIHLEQLLEGAYFPVDTFKSGNVVLQFDRIVEQHFSLQATMQVERCVKQIIQCDVKQGSTEVVLGDIYNFQIGYTAIEMEIMVGDICITKHFGIEIYSEVYLKLQTDHIEDRKRMALDFTSLHGEPNMHKLLSILYCSEDIGSYEINPKMFHEILEGEMKKINERSDCSDFSLIMFFRFLRDYHKSDIVTAKTIDQIKQMILHFRYWMDEPGNDVMWFFSENHALMFHTCEILAGQMFPDEHFTNAGISGREHYQRGEARLHAWFERFFNEGLSEWNSAPYIPINVIGLTTLYDLIDSSVLKTYAKRALDQIFKWLALNSYQGFLTCSQGRVYEKELKGNYNTQTTSLAWLAWGEGALNYSTFGSVALSLSDYIPPVKYSKFLSVPNGNALSYLHKQGPDDFANLYTYKTSAYMLSSALHFKPGEKGYQEHVLQASIGPEANVWVNHPGEKSVQSSGRPSYWAGNGYLPKVAQYKSIAFAIFNIEEEHDVDFTHAYTPLFAFDFSKIVDKWIFLQKGNSYIGLFAQNGIQLVGEGMNKNREVISPGRNNLWIVRMGSSEEFGSFDTFQRMLIEGKMEISDKQEIYWIDPHIGTCSFSWDEDLKVNDTKMTIQSRTIDGKINFY